jgi:hypothetical protein
MDHLAAAIGMDPFEFRIRNMIGSSDQIFNPLPEIIPQLRASSEYDKRKLEIEEFNQVFLFLKFSNSFSILFASDNNFLIFFLDSSYYFSSELLEKKFRLFFHLNFWMPVLFGI